MAAKSPFRCRTVSTNVFPFGPRSFVIAHEGDEFKAAENDTVRYRLKCENAEAASKLFESITDEQLNYAVAVHKPRKPASDKATVSAPDNVAAASDAEPARRPDGTIPLVDGSEPTDRATRRRTR